MPRLNRFIQLSAFALALVIAQIGVTAAFSGARAPGQAYLKLLNWDSWHYDSIATKGYSYPANGHVVSDDIHAGRANVVFFPGYPLAAHEVHELTGASVETSLLWVAHLSAWIAWLYFLLLLDGAALSRERRWGAVLAAAVYPSCFFMVTGYTESLFLAASLGFIFWSDRWVERNKPVAWFIALLHGWILALTRIVGFAVAGYPAARDFVRGKRFSDRFRAASITLLFLSVLTSFAFFWYCHVKFGDWAVYFRLERIGWQNRPEYFAILNPLTYVPHFFFEQTIDSFSRSSVTLGGALFAVWGIAEWRIFKRTGEFAERRIARALVAFAMFYIAVTGKANSHLDSMLRYTLPVYFLLVLNFADLNELRVRAGEPILFFSGPRRVWKLGLALFLGIGIQVWCMYRFTHGHWVA